MITEDIAKLVVQIENDTNNKELMNELTKLQQKTGSLKDENKRLAAAMEVLRAQGQQNGDEFKKIKDIYDTNSRSITENEKRMKMLRQTMNNTMLSANDLRKKAADLQKELNSMTRAADPERFDRLNKELKEMQRQLQQVRAGTNETGSAFGNLLNMGKKLLPTFIGIQGTIAIIKQGFDLLKNGIKNALDMEPVQRAFDRLNKPGLLNNLREATRGTVSDLQLMQTAIKANNFQIPLENMGKLLEFAQRRARETGESVDHLVDSIITGISRKSLPILDNLGLSATRLRDSAAQTGDFITGVIKIVNEELEMQGQYIESNIDRVERFKIKWNEFWRTAAEGILITGEWLVGLFDDSETKMEKGKAKQYKNLLDQQQQFIASYNEYNAAGRADARREIEHDIEYAKNMLRDAQSHNNEEGEKYAKTILVIYKKTQQEFAKIDNLAVKGNYTTIESLQKEIEILTTQLKQIDVNSKEFAETQKVIVKKQEELNRIVGKGGTGSDTAYKNEITAVENRNRELRKKELAKYEAGLIDKEAYDKQIETLEDKLIKEKLVINKKYEKDTGTLEDQVFNRTVKRVEDIAKMTEKQREKSFKDDMAAAENYYRAEKKKQADDYTHGLIDKQQYNDGIAGLEQLLLQEKLALYIQYGKDTAAIEDQIIANHIKCYEELQKQLSEIRKKEDKEKADYEKQLESEAAAIIKELRSNNIRESANYELKKLEELHKRGLLTEKQYEQKKLNIKLSAAEKYAQKAAQLAQLGGNLVSAMQDAEFSSLEAQKEKELALAGDNSEKRQQIEEEYEAKKLDVQKKYADVDMAAKIAQTIAAGALAVIQAWAQLGPVAGSVAAAIIGATTVFQIASIVEQRNAIKNMTPSSSGGSTSTAQRVVLPGKEDGGFVDAERTQDGKRFRARKRKKRGYANEPTVLVGEAGAEFVANAEAVENPTVKPILDMIDIAQRTGDISSLNLPELIRTSGMESGGYTAPPTDGGMPVNANNAAQAATDREIILVLNDIRAFLQYLKDNGVKAPVVLTEFEKKMALLNRSRELGSRT